jgi:hypothetical protein
MIQQVLSSGMIESIRVFLSKVVDSGLHSRGREVYLFQNLGRRFREGIGPLLSNGGRKRTVTKMQFFQRVQITVFNVLSKVLFADIETGDPKSSSGHHLDDEYSTQQFAEECISFFSPI